MVPRVHRRAPAPRRSRVRIEIRGPKPVLRPVRIMGNLRVRGPVVRRLQPLARRLGAVGVAHVGRTTGQLPPVGHAPRVRGLAVDVLGVKTTWGARARAPAAFAPDVASRGGEAEVESFNSPRANNPAAGRWNAAVDFARKEYVADKRAAAERRRARMASEEAMPMA